VFELQIAWRYLFSKKSVNAINIINYISMAAMGVGAFALIVVLSVFNGFEGLIKELHRAFYPEIIVVPAEGKFFESDSATMHLLQKHQQVKSIASTLEENAYLEYSDRATIATIKGISNNYSQTNEIKNHIRKGVFLTHEGSQEFAIVGANINTALNVSLENSLEPLKISVPKNSNATVFLPEDAFNNVYVFVSGIFSVQQEFDSKYVFVSLETARQLIGEENALSAYEVKLKSGTNPNTFKKEMEAALGKQYTIKTRDEINETLYRVVQLERWAVYAILTFILIIISFNILGSLAMLGIEKQKDISILKAMGATALQIKNIFLLEGAFSGLLGGIIGVALGLAVCFLQQYFGFIKLAQGGASFVIDAYPVKVLTTDVLLSLATVAVISSVAAFIPAYRASRQAINFSS